MHELVRRYVTRNREPLRLMRYRLDSGALVLAFQAGQAHPVWIAKRGTGERAQIRLRAEKRALERLQTWRGRLGIPALLDWVEDGSECWLVQSGMAGQIEPMPLSPRGRPTLHLAMAVEWLHSFQELAAPVVAAELPDLTRQWQAEFFATPDEFSPPLWQQVRALPAPGLAAVPVHGDYWAGNLLFQTDRLSVIDWSGFEAGTPLQDLLTLLFRAPMVSRGRLMSGRDAFVTVFFASSPMRELLTEWVRRRRLRIDEACFCFYLFLARRLRWELGYSLQTRSEHERARAKEHWRPILDWLAEHEYPNPFVDHGL